MNKPVVEVTTEDMWNYEFQAKLYRSNNTLSILASNSLPNLKRAVRDRGWRGPVWLTTTVGSFSYGQNVVSEYPYCPRY